MRRRMALPDWLAPQVAIWLALGYNTPMREHWDMLGHQWAVELLQKNLAQDRLRHAYLFTGPHGVGRRTLALRFAQAINGSPIGTYDPEATASRLFERMQHPDLTVVQREEGDRDIKIEAVRALQHTLSLSPYMANYRIALLLNFEDANDNTANALLKTLEEPSARVVLMLTAESTEALLPTIVSRCEIIRLRPVPLDDLAEGLQTLWQIEPGTAQLAAHLSGGRPGYARFLAQNPEVLAERQDWLEDLHSLLSANHVTRFAYAEKASKDKEQFGQFLQVWLAYWRDVMLCVSGSRAPLTNSDRAEEIRALAESLDLETARQAVLALERTLGETRTNVNPRLAAEALMLELPRLR